ncbi:MAG: RNA polymerase sigma factor [Oceanococcus sp.]
MAVFPETQWSLIQRSGETPTLRHAAFSDLARDYRPAIAAFFRARLSSADADDAVQSFLAASFEHGWWARARAEAGSFRGFLLLLMRRHLGRIRSRRRFHEPLSDANEPSDSTPDAERLFDARFALILVDKALTELRASYQQRGREPLFLELVQLLREKPEHGGLQAAAAKLGLAPNTLTVEIRRLRQRLNEQTRCELEQLCANQQTFQQEWSTLRSIIVDN